MVSDYSGPQSQDNFSAKTSYILMLFIQDLDFLQLLRFLPSRFILSCLDLQESLQMLQVHTQR